MQALVPCCMPPWHTCIAAPPHHASSPAACPAGALLCGHAGPGAAAAGPGAPGREPARCGGARRCLATRPSAAAAQALCHRVSRFRLASGVGRCMLLRCLGGLVCTSRLRCAAALMHWPLRRLPACWLTLLPGISSPQPAPLHRLRADKRHPVLTPAGLFICSCLSNCPLARPQHVGTGGQCSNLAHERTHARTHARTHVRTQLGLGKARPLG